MTLGDQEFLPQVFLEKKASQDPQVRSSMILIFPRELVPNISVVMRLTGEHVLPQGDQDHLVA